MKNMQDMQNIKKFSRLRNFFRLLHISFILARYRIDTIVLQHHYFYSVRFLALLNPWNWRFGAAAPHTRGQAIRLALEALGPVFVKFGQMLSTRRDLLPEDIADELAKLQDQVLPFRGELAREILAREYGCLPTEIFSEFDLTPLASASIAQVHAARLVLKKQEIEETKDVVVKILRPHIRKQIERDVAVMYFLANLTARYWKRARRLKAREIVQEFEESILGELDLLREAANASQLRRNFSNSKDLYVPEIYWEYTRHNVLVMERIYGIPIRNIAELQEARINFKKLAERGIQIFFTQVFRDCFFHADMHPGNIFVAHGKPEDPQYIAVDFGIMGSLNPVDQRYIAENFLAFFKRDYRRVAVLHVESGWAPPDTRIDQLEAAIRTVCEPIFERPLAEISFGQLLLRLFQMAAKFDIEIQPQLILLQKTLLNIEGLGRQLYPQLDLWQTAKPFLERWVRKQVGPKAFIRKVREYAPLWLEQLPEWPQLIYNSLQQQQKSPIISHDDTAKTKHTHGRFLMGFFWGLGLAIISGGFFYYFIFQDFIF